MPYIPGENKVTCDLSGRECLMSETRKTWDGLRVWTPLWYPKHPQLFVRGIPERSRVIDGRPDQEWIRQAPAYGFGSFCLYSSDGTNYVVNVQDDGALFVTAATWGTPQPVFYISTFAFTVDDDGALRVTDGYVVATPQWYIWSASGLKFKITVAVDGAVFVTFVTGNAYMDGVFTLISPNGTKYVVYIADDKSVIVTTGTWGPISTAFFLDNYKITVANDGALLAVTSGEQHQPTYRMVSVGGYEYFWFVDPDGAVKIGREGHFWDTPVVVPVLVSNKDWVPYDLDGIVTESDQYVWRKE